MQGEYGLECTESSCKGRRVVIETLSVGWKVGDVVHIDTSEPDRLRCPHCKRGKMRVSKVPVFRQEVPLKGFSKLPKE